MRVIHSFIARQLAKPSGLFGRYVTSRWLDKSSLMMNRVAFDRLALLPRDRVLEVGFGSGYLLERILSSGLCSRACGVDRSDEMVRLVRRRLAEYIKEGKADIRKGSVEALPNDDGEFTKLCAVNTIYFWQDLSVALPECRRVLDAGGLLVLCFNAKRDLARWPGHKHGFRLYELTEVEAELGKAGFEVTDVISENDPAQGLFHCVSAKAVA